MVMEHSLLGELIALSSTLECVFAQAKARATSRPTLGSVVALAGMTPATTEAPISSADSARAREVVDMIGIA